MHGTVYSLNFDPSFDRISSCMEAIVRAGRWRWPTINKRITQPKQDEAQREAE